MKILIGLLVVLGCYGQGPNYNSSVNKPVISVTGTPYFARGNGVHDDTAAIQSAWNACAGGTLYFPPGTYLLNTATSGVIFNILNTNNNILNPGVIGGCSISGSGIGRTITKTTSATATLMAAISTGTVFYPFYDIHDLTLQGPSAPTCTASGGTGGNGLQISGTAAVTVYLRNLLVTGFCGSGSIGIWLDNAEMFQVDHIRADYDDIGLKLSSASNSSVANNVTVDQNHSYGGYVSGGTGNITWNSLLVQSNYKTGLYLSNSSGSTFNSPHFENNNSSATSGQHALWMDATAGAVYGNYLAGAVFATITDDIFAQGNSTPGHVVSHNTVFIGGPSGFQVGAKINLSDIYSVGNIWAGVTAANFTNPPQTTEEILDGSGPFTSGALLPLLPSVVLGPVDRLSGPVGNCASGFEGQLWEIKNANTNIIGATITSASGTFHVLAGCDGTNLYVAAAAGGSNAVVFGTGGTNNAITVTLPGATLTPGQCFTAILSNSLQAGANTITLNGTGGAVALKSSLQPANNIATAYVAGGTLSACYDGAKWQDLKQ